MASPFSLVAERILFAWLRLSRSPPTEGERTSRSRMACCWFSCACCWFTSCWNENGSSRASTCPGRTVSPTLTATSTSWAALENPRFCVVTDASAPEADTFVETCPRSTLAVDTAGGEPPQAAVTETTTTASDTAATNRLLGLAPRVFVRLINSPCLLPASELPELIDRPSITRFRIASPRNLGNNSNNTNNTNNTTSQPFRPNSQRGTICA